MPTITELATMSIRSYPGLYPTRLSFLASVFSTYGGGGVQFDLTTGGFKFHPGLVRGAPVFDTIPEDTIARVKRMQEQVIEQWISDHADEIANELVFDELTHIPELAWPSTLGWPSKEIAWEEMNEDTQSAFREILFAYDDIYSEALRLRDWGPARDSNLRKTWDLSNPNISRILLGAQALLERVTGQTREEREAEKTALMNELFAEMKEEGTW